MLKFKIEIEKKMPRNVRHLQLLESYLIILKFLSMVFKDSFLILFKGFLVTEDDRKRAVDNAVI